jgi:hypothetical protein
MHDPLQRDGMFAAVCEIAGGSSFRMAFIVSALIGF